ncbi:hypothetical protein CF327_g7430 [Tilletia walkeri]|nr:hypothetical protein CF327_g7430 [Tilletia walkeri]
MTPPYNAVGTRQGNGEHRPNYHAGPVLSHNNSPDRSSNGVGYLNHNGPATHHNLGGTPHTNNGTAAPVQRRHDELPPFHNAGPPSNYNNGATVPGFFVNDGGAPHPNNVNTTSNPYRHNDPPPASNTGPSLINLNGVTHHHTNGSSAPLNHSNDRGPLQNTGQTAYNPNHVGQAHNPDVPNDNGTGRTPVNSGVGLPNNVGMGPTANIGGAAPLHQNNVGGSSFGNVAFNNVPSHFNSGNVYYTTQPCLRDGTAASATEAFEAPPPAPPLTQPGSGPWLGSWGPT